MLFATVLIYFRMEYIYCHIFYQWFLTRYHVYIHLILVDRADPYYSVPAMHFNSLMSRYGSPLIILNLVKVCIHVFYYCFQFSSADTWCHFVFLRRFDVFIFFFLRILFLLTCSVFNIYNDQNKIEAIALSLS